MNHSYPWTAVETFYGSRGDYLGSFFGPLSLLSSFFETKRDLLGTLFAILVPLGTNFRRQKRPSWDPFSDPSLWDPLYEALWSKSDHFGSLFRPLSPLDKVGEPFGNLFWAHCPYRDAFSDYCPCWYSFFGPKKGPSAEAAKKNEFYTDGKYELHTISTRKSHQVDFCSNAKSRQLDRRTVSNVVWDSKKTSTTVILTNNQLYSTMRV
jgi:hypothetical protein